MKLNHDGNNSPLLGQDIRKKSENIYPLMMQLTADEFLSPEVKLEKIFDKNDIIQKLSKQILELKEENQ